MKVNKLLRAMRIKTEAATCVVIRTITGKKIFEMDLAGVVITITVPTIAKVQTNKRGSR